MLLFLFLYTVSPLSNKAAKNVTWGTNSEGQEGVYLWIGQRLWRNGAEAIWGVLKEGGKSREKEERAEQMAMLKVGNVKNLK